MADIAGLAKIFEQADQITIGLTLPAGVGAVVTLDETEMRLVAQALQLAAKSLERQ